MRISSNRFVPISSRRISGFTLLEVMVALAVIATVLVSVYKLHAQSLALAHETRFYGIAPFLAQQKLAEMTAGGTDLQESETGDFGEDFPGFHWRLAVEEIEFGIQEKKAIGFTKIDLTVFSNENEYQFNLRTYRLVKS